MTHQPIKPKLIEIWFRGKNVAAEGEPASDTASPPETLDLDNVEPDSTEGESQ